MPGTGTCPGNSKMTKVLLPPCPGGEKQHRGDVITKVWRESHGTTLHAEAEPPERGTVTDSERRLPEGKLVSSCSKQRRSHLPRQRLERVQPVSETARVVVQNAWDDGRVQSCQMAKPMTSKLKIMKSNHGEIRLKLSKLKLNNHLSTNLVQSQLRKWQSGFGKYQKCRKPNPEKRLTKYNQRETQHQ